MIDKLFDGNLRWAKEKVQAEPDFFRRLSRQQAPDYLWIGCSDSRVPANEIVGLDPGELFVHRNVANVVHSSDLNLLSVLEFAVERLKIRHIIVCGHYGCAGVNAALTGEPMALSQHWLAPIRQAAALHAEDLEGIPNPARRAERLCELNVEMQVRRLADCPVITAAWTRGQDLTLHGWIYSLEDGLLRDLEMDISGPGQLSSPGPDDASDATGD